MGEDIKYPGFRWYVLIAFLVLQISTTLISISPAPIIGDIAKSLNMSLGATTGSVMGVVNLVIAIACIVAGFLVDRFGFVKMLIAGAVLMIIPTAALPLFGDSFPRAYGGTHHPESWQWACLRFHSNACSPLVSSPSKGDCNRAPRLCGHPGVCHRFCDNAPGI